MVKISLGGTISGLLGDFEGKWGFDLLLNSYCMNSCQYLLTHTFPHSHACLYTICVKIFSL